MTIKKISRIAKVILIGNILVFIIMAFLFANEGNNKYNSISIYFMVFMSFITLVVIAGFNFFVAKDELAKWQKALFGINTILALGITMFGLRAVIEIPRIVQNQNIRYEREERQGVMPIDTLNKSDESTH